MYVSFRIHKSIFYSRKEHYIKEDKNVRGEKQQLIKPFYSEEKEQVLAEVQTTEEGLTSAEAENA